jgi:DNA ligase (NAD+)
MSDTQLPVEQLTEQEAAEELARLAAEIAEHDRRYHAEDAPTISDADYDALRIRNAEIEGRFPELVREDSPSLKVGASPSGTFGPVVHAKPMLSLDNALSDEDVRDFVASVRRFLAYPPDQELVFTAEPKIDGLSMSLRYERGHLVTAATRGDGTTGEMSRQTSGRSKFPNGAQGCARCREKPRRSLYAPRRLWRSTSGWLRAAASLPIPQTAAGSLPTRPEVTRSRPLKFFAYAWGETASVGLQFDVVRRFGDWGRDQRRMVLQVGERSRRTTTRSRPSGRDALRHRRRVCKAGPA